MLFFCGIAELIGLIAYHDVFQNITATGCCGFIADDSDKQWLCNTNDFVDSKIERTIDDNANIICVVNEVTSCTAKKNTTMTIYDSFTGIVDYNFDDETIVNGNFHISDLCSEEAIAYEEEHAGDVAMNFITYGIVLIVLSSIGAIFDILRYLGCIKEKSCCTKCCSCLKTCCTKCFHCLTCSCCCPRLFAFYGVVLQLVAWITLYTLTMKHVENAASEGYKLEVYSNEAPLPDYGFFSREMIGAAVADKAGVEGFLWMDYHLDKLPAIVDNVYYEAISIAGLTFSIIEFAIAIVLVCCGKNDVEAGVARKETDSASDDKL